MAGRRFRDDGRRIEDFVDRVLVVCPRCAARAEVRRFDPGDDKRRTAVASLQPRRLVCTHCGLTRTHLNATAGFGRATDPYFDLPLALQAHAAGQVIWAYNEDHVEHMLAFVEATIRERAIPVPPDRAVPASLLEKMPGWFGEAANRDVIAKALKSMRST